MFFNDLIEGWENFLEKAEGASEVELTPEHATVRGQEEDGSTWEYYQYSDENFIRISEYNQAS